MLLLKPTRIFMTVARFSSDFCCRNIGHSWVWHIYWVRRFP